MSQLKTVKPYENYIAKAGLYGDTFLVGDTVNNWLAFLEMPVLFPDEESVLIDKYPVDEMAISELDNVYLWFCDKIVNARVVSRGMRFPDLNSLSLPIDNFETINQTTKSLAKRDEIGKLIHFFGVKK